MSKVTLNDIADSTSKSSAYQAVNTNNAAVETAMENTLSRDGTSPNSMDANIDMNSNRILNLAAPVSEGEPLRLEDLDTFLNGSLTFSTLPAGGSENDILTKAGSSDYDFVWSNTISTTDVTADDIMISGKITESHNVTTTTCASDFDVLQYMVGIDSCNAGVVMDSFGAFPFIMSRRANGTAASKTAPASNDLLFEITCRGYDGTNYTTTGSSKIDWYASSNWTSSQQGAGIRFLSTRDADTFTSVREVVRIGSDGGLAVGTTTTPGSGAIVATQAIRSTGTGGVGYTTGAGGSVTQTTNKSSGVTINKVCGIVTTNSASLAANTIVAFVMSNTTVTTGDVMVLNHVSGGTPGAYTLNARCSNAVATIDIRNNTGGTLAEAVSIAFALVKGVTS